MTDDLTPSEKLRIEAMEYLDDLASVVNQDIVPVPVPTLRILRDFLADAKMEILFLREFVVVTERELRETRRYARSKGVRIPPPPPGGGNWYEQSDDGAG